MVVAFTLTWSWLLIRRYQLARMQATREEAARYGRVVRAREKALAKQTTATRPIEAGDATEAAR
jgi:hypothetical protein